MLGFQVNAFQRGAFQMQTLGWSVVPPRPGAWDGILAAREIWNLKDAADVVWSSDDSAQADPWTKRNAGSTSWSKKEPRDG